MVKIRGKHRNFKGRRERVEFPAGKLRQLRTINRRFSCRFGNPGKRTNSAWSRRTNKLILSESLTDCSCSWQRKIAKKLIMQKYNLAIRTFDMEEQSSCSSPDSIIYISSSSDDEQSDGWDSDWSSETEDMIKKIEQGVASSPMLIGSRIMTTGKLEEQMIVGPITAQTNSVTIPKLGLKDFDEKFCYAPPTETSKTMIELCKTLLLPVMDSVMSPPPHERGIVRTPHCCSRQEQIITRPTISRVRNPTQTLASRDLLIVWYATCQ